MPVQANPSIIISSYTLDPQIFMPGDQGILSLTIRNAETTATRTSTTDSTTTVATVGARINNIRVEPVYAGTKTIRVQTDYDDVCYLAPTASIQLHFKLTVDQGFPEGMYFPVVEIDVESYDDVAFPILINVSNTTIQLLPTHVPSTMSQSGSTEISLTVINNRHAPVNNVIVSSQSTNGTTISPEQMYLGTLPADSSQKISFTVNPKQTGKQNLSFILSYDNGDNAHTETMVFSTTVINTLDVAPILYSVPSVISKGSVEKIRLEVYNAKTESLTGVLITPITDAKVSPSQYFIGSMDPDDAFSASFDLSTENLDVGTYSISFIVTFKQGMEYYTTTPVDATFSIVEEQQNGFPFLMIFGIIAVVAIILLILIFWFRRRSRRTMT